MIIYTFHFNRFVFSSTMSGYFQGDPKLFVKTLQGETYTLDYSSRDTVGDVKRKLRELLDIELNEQRLIFAGKQLEDGRTLADYCVQRESTFHLVLRMHGAGEEKKSLIQEIDYKPMFPEMRRFSNEMLLQPLKPNFVQSHSSNVFAFPLFTPHFCKNLTREIENFLNVTNDSGIALRMSYLGLSGLFEGFMKQFDPFMKELFPSLKNESYEILPKVMRYDTKTNNDWPRHLDGDLATLNICLSNGFSGAKFRVFHEETTTDFPHNKPGHALMHLGNVEHSVTPLAEGVRHTLIIKIRSKGS